MSFAAAASSRLAPPCGAFRRCPGVLLVLRSAHQAQPMPLPLTLQPAASVTVTAVPVGPPPLRCPYAHFCLPFPQPCGQRQPGVAWPGGLHGLRARHWWRAALGRTLSKAGWTSLPSCPLPAAAAGAPPTTSWQTRLGARCTWTSRAGTCERACCWWGWTSTQGVHPGRGQCLTAPASAASMRMAYPPGQYARPSRAAPC